VRGECGGMRGDVVGENKEMHRKGDYRGTKQGERSEMSPVNYLRRIQLSAIWAAKSEEQVDSQL